MRLLLSSEKGEQREMNEVSVEVQESREMMLALEKEEFDLGKRKRSHDYVCFRCGKMTHGIQGMN